VKREPIRCGRCAARLDDPETPTGAQAAADVLSTGAGLLLTTRSSPPGALVSTWLCDVECLVEHVADPDTEPPPPPARRPAGQVKETPTEAAELARRRHPSRALVAVPPLT